MVEPRVLSGLGLIFVGVLVALVASATAAPP
jgi:hypothetical protein